MSVYRNRNPTTYWAGLSKAAVTLPIMAKYIEMRVRWNLNCLTGITNLAITSVTFPTVVCCMRIRRRRTSCRRVTRAEGQRQTDSKQWKRASHNLSAYRYKQTGSTQNSLNSVVSVTPNVDTIIDGCSAVRVQAPGWALFCLRVDFGFHPLEKCIELCTQQGTMLGHRSFVLMNV